MNHKYWMQEHMEINKNYDGIDRRHDLLENFPILSFYLVSMLVVVGLITF